MKGYFILAILLSLSSCAVIKIVAEQDISALETCTPIRFESNFPLVDVMIDSVKTSLLLDTGATICVIVDSSKIPNFQNKKFYHFGSSTGADKKSSKNRFFTASLVSKTVECRNKVFAFFKLPKQECSKQENFTGIMGMDVFFENNMSLSLDFVNNQMCNISEESKNEQLKNRGYKHVKSECKKNMVFVFLIIENIEYKFKLDTGFIGDLIIPRSKGQVFKNQDFRALEGSMFSTLTSRTVGNEQIFDGMSIKFGTQTFQSPVIVSSTIASQNGGINFIKKFNWIIDYEKNEVYIKPNSNIESTIVKQKIQYKAAESNGSLFIRLKEKSQFKFNIGDQITSVNSKQVTTENICELLSFLNKAEDWNTLDLEVIHK